MINLTESPVSQSFVWVAEYSDGTYFSEFDYATKKENSFYSIDRSKLIRFGLSGYGMRLYYETLGGIFKLAGKMIEIYYKVGDKEYYLAGQPIFYKDIISYKDAEAMINLKTGAGTSQSQITQFNFGYKQNLSIDGVNFNFKVICCVPYGGKVYLNIRIVADKDLNGVLCIKKNGICKYEMEAPLNVGVSGETNWVVSD